MKRPLNIHRRRGVGILLLVIVIALVGVALLMLTNAASHMTYQSRQVQADAYLVNIHESTVTWARQNPARLAALAPGKSLTLDMASLGIADATATVELVKRDGNDSRIRITSVCTVNKRKPSRTIETTIQSQ